VVGLGEDAYRDSCKKYPLYIISDKTNFPVYYEEHISIFEKYRQKMR
jgi:hypothetical protein